MAGWTQGKGQRRLWKAEEFDGLKPTVYDWVRMAAFLDGEGNLNINPRRSHSHVVQVQTRILIGNTNPALPLWLRKTFGGNIVLRNQQKYNPRAKQTYIWSCTAARAAWVLTNCLPWFLLKGAQAEILIALQEDIDRTRQGRGIRVPEGSWERRFALKDELHRLNAKGCKNQIVIPVAGLTGE